jgi:hypothetical protein
MDIFSWPSEPSTGTYQSDIHFQCASRPHLTGCPPDSAKQRVQGPVGVSDDIEWQPQIVAIEGETVNTGKANNGDPGITELVEVIAHGDHVLLTWQSGEVTVQDQHQRETPKLGRPPRPTVVVDEFNIGQQITNVQRHTFRGCRLGHQQRAAAGWPVGAMTKERTCLAVGLTMELVPTVTVGTVSFRLATDRASSW